MQRICVFCGSKVGKNGFFVEAARQLGQQMAARGYGLVFGGGSVGLMGVVANAVLASGGDVIGVLPELLATKELRHPAVTEMHITDGMHSRKATMVELADAFIALPGGFGTFEELLEVITWAQLGIHAKPIGLFNIAGYYDPLVRLVEIAIAEGFVKQRNRDLFLVADNVDQMLDRLATHQMPAVKQWLTTKET